ncbi:MAG: inositol monophosphatase family protein, partial [Ilumatobacter sp.]
MQPSNEHGPDREQRRIDHHDAHAVLDLFRSVTARTTFLLADNGDWSMAGRSESQYAVDIEIDRACLAMLHGAGFTVLSEESGLTDPDGRRLDAAEDALVVVDPLDGSTNASLGLPWCATALCLVLDGVPTVAHVANLRTGTRFEAIRGSGATRDGRPIHVAAPVALVDAVIGVNARPPDGFRPRQHRGMGATALDITSVATSGAVGGFDGTIDFDDDMIGVWDYLASVLILEEAGGVAADVLDRDLTTTDHAARRRPVTATSV